MWHWSRSKSLLHDFQSPLLDIPSLSSVGVATVLCRLGPAAQRSTASPLQKWVQMCSMCGMFGVLEQAGLTG